MPPKSIITGRLKGLKQALGGRTSDLETTARTLFLLANNNPPSRAYTTIHRHHCPCFLVARGRPADSAVRTARPGSRITTSKQRHQASTALQHGAYALQPQQAGACGQGVGEVGL